MSFIVDLTYIGRDHSHALLSFGNVDKDITTIDLFEHNEELHYFHEELTLLDEDDDDSHTINIFGEDITHSFHEWREVCGNINDFYLMNVFGNKT